MLKLCVHFLGTIFLNSPPLLRIIEMLSHIEFHCACALLKYVSILYPWTIFINYFAILSAFILHGSLNSIERRVLPEIFDLRTFLTLFFSYTNRLNDVAWQKVEIAKYWADWHCCCRFYICEQFSNFAHGRRASVLFKRVSTWVIFSLLFFFSPFHHGKRLFAFLCFKCHSFRCRVIHFVFSSFSFFSFHLFVGGTMFHHPSFRWIFPGVSGIFLPDFHSKWYVNYAFFHLSTLPYIHVSAGKS